MKKGVRLVFFHIVAVEGLSGIHRSSIITLSVGMFSHAGGDGTQVSGAEAKSCSSGGGGCTDTAAITHDKHPRKICPLYLKLHARYTPHGNSLPPRMRQRRRWILKLADGSGGEPPRTSVHEEARARCSSGPPENGSRSGAAGASAALQRSASCSAFC